MIRLIKLHVKKAFVVAFVSGGLVISPAIASTESLTPLQRQMAQIPLAFEQNQGQVAEGIKFTAKGPGYDVALTDHEAILLLSKRTSGGLSNAAPSTNDFQTARISIRLDGANPTPKAEGDEPLGYKTNYFTGKEQKQQFTNIENFAKVRYSSVYKGIDLAYYGNQQQLEYDFILAPGANPKEIKVRFEGAKNVSLSKSGELVLSTNVGDVVFMTPVAYQENGKSRSVVDVKYVLAENGAVVFEVGSYDLKKTLVIDPILSYSSFLWGDNAAGVALDAAGNIYVTGHTILNDLPATGGYQATLPGGISAYVIKINPAGTQKLYATYLGMRNSTTYARHIALDTFGNAIITGFSNSDSFPTTSGAYQVRAHASDYTNAFITKLNATGSSLLYSSFLNRVNQLDGLAVDGGGSAYVAGKAFALATSAGAYRPTNPSPDSAIPFVIKLQPTGASMAYATFFGPGSQIHAIAADATGHAYVTGMAWESHPSRDGFQAFGGVVDAFVSKLNPGGTDLVYSTFLGGSQLDIARAITVDAAGQAYVAGYTQSDNFPTTAGVFQPVKGSPGLQSNNAFITKINSAGSGMVFSSFLGGAGTFSTGSFGSQNPDTDIITAIAVDATQHVYVGGTTDTASFPSVDPILALGAMRKTASFVAKIKPTGDRIVYSVIVAPAIPACPNCLTTTEGRSLNGIAVDSTGAVIAVGSLIEQLDWVPSLQVNPTVFDSRKFFPTAGALKTTGNAFITKLSTGKFPTLLRSSVNPSRVGEELVLTADVQSTVPGGTVTFMSGAQTIGTASAIEGTASLTISLPIGGHPITAVYSGDGKVSPPIFQIISAQ